tara:strand:- start:675 stop:911 length:237 start_codon:yes stop_codon:yes gene_type:complete
LSLEIDSFSNVIFSKPLKPLKAESKPYNTTKTKQAKSFTLQVTFPFLSGNANNGLCIQKLIDYSKEARGFLQKNRSYI